MISIVGEPYLTILSVFLRAAMETTRKGLREGQIEKDTYERLVCAECGESLQTDNDPDQVFNVKRCPECGTEWKELH